MSVQIDTHGLKFFYDGGKKPVEMKRVMMNPACKAPLEACCKALAGWGYTEFHTLGIINNRPQRRNRKVTSRHATGLAPFFKAWRDGSNGSLAIDFVWLEHSDPTKCKHIAIQYKRNWLIKFWESRGWRLYHTGRRGDPRWKGADHLHLEIVLRGRL